MHEHNGWFGKVVDLFPFSTAAAAFEVISWYLIHGHEGLLELVFG